VGVPFQGAAFYFILPERAASSSPDSVPPSRS
jgi:hypothetical protein